MYRAKVSGLHGSDNVLRRITDARIVPTLLLSRVVEMHHSSTPELPERQQSGVRPLMPFDGRIDSAAALSLSALVAMTVPAPGQEQI